jgi:AraC-like DNA-binding protein
MPNLRHDPDSTVLLRTFGVTFGIGRPHDPHKLSPPHAEGWHRLICATRGMLTVHASDCSWAVPPHRAIWIPAGLRCTVEMHGETALRMLYLRSRIGLPVSVVNVTPLMRELIARAVHLGALDSSVPAQKRLYEVVRDELKTLRAVPLQLPALKDPRAQRLTAMADRNWPLARLLRHSGAARRTMERIFQDETAMSLGQWLRRRKLLRAVHLLAEGHPVKVVALELGYAHPSAFIAMFRRELGETPTRYL